MNNLYEVVKIWLEAVGGDKIANHKHILSSKGIKKIIGVEKCKNYASFVRKLFPSFNSDCPVLSGGLSLIYAAFPTKPECLWLRDEVLCHLDTNVQLAIQTYLQFFTETDFKDVDASLVAKAGARVPDLAGNLVLSPGEGTPSRLVLSPETESPLQRFFQTPRRKESKTNRRWNCQFCANGERIKQMQTQMDEDETERNLLIVSQNNLKSVVADLEKKLQQESCRNDNLAANSINNQSDLSEKVKQIEVLEEKCLKYQRNLSVLQDDLNFTQKCLTETADRLAVMEKLVISKDSTLKETANNLETTLGEFDAMFVEKRGLEKKLEARDLAYQELQETLQAMKITDSCLEPDFNNSVNQTENLGDQLLLDARREIVELAEKLETAEELVKTLLNAKQEMEVDFERRFREQSSVVLALDVENSRLKEIVESWQQKCADHLSAFEKAESNASKLEDELKKSTKETETRVAELRVIAEKLVEFKMVVAEKEQQLTQLTSAKDESDSRLKACEIHVQQLQSEKNEVEADFKKSQDDFKQLGVKLMQSQADFDYLLVKFKNQEAELTENAAHLSKLQENVEKVVMDKFKIQESYELVLQNVDCLRASELKIAAEKNKLEKVVECQEEEIRVLRGRAAEKDETLNQLTSEINQKQVDYDRMVGELKTTEVQVESLHNQLTESQLEISNLKNDISVVVEQKTQLENQNADLLAVNTRLGGELNTVTNEKQALDILLEDRVSELTKKQTEYEKLGLQLMQNQADFDDLSVKFKNQEAELTDNAANLSKLQENFEKVVMDKFKIQESYELVLQNVDCLRASELKIAAEKNKMVESQEEEIRVLRGKAAEKDETLNQLTSEINQKQLDYDRMVGELKTTEIQVKSLHNQLTESQLEINNLKNDISVVMEQKTQLEKMVESQEEDILVLRGKGAEKDETLNQLTSEINQKQLDYDRMGGELKTTEVQVESLQNQLTKSQLEINNLKNDISVVVEEKTQLENQNADLLVVNTRLGGDLNTVTNKKQALDILLEDRVSELTKKQTEYEKLELDIASLTAQLKEYELKYSENVCDLTTTIQRLESELVEKNLKHAEECQRLQDLLTKNSKEFMTKHEAQCLEISGLMAAIHEKESTIEQQAVEFNREKMQLISQMESHQRESATTCRNLEAKNLALDEVKKVAMAKVNEILVSHGQLRREFDDLIADKSAQNTQLGLEVNEARNKCRNLADDLAQAVNDVEKFKVYVRDLKLQRDQLNLVVEEKTDAIEEMKSKQINRMKQLFGKMTDNTELSFDLENITNLESLVEKRENAFAEVKALASKLQSDLQQSRVERNRLVSVLESVKLKMKFWANPLIQQLIDNVGNDRFREILKKIPTSLDDTPLTDEIIEDVLSHAQDNFMKLINYLDVREQLEKKCNDDYQTMEQRMLSLAEINSRLSTEILRAKNLSQVELTLHENELVSLKSTVSQLNQKIEQLSSSRMEIEVNYETIVKDNQKLIKDLNVLTETLKTKTEASAKLFEILVLKERVDKMLNSVKTTVPEMMTVITTLDGRRNDLVGKLLSGQIDNSAEFLAIFTDFKDIWDNLELIRMKKPEELSDSLEELSVQEKTFQIINLHDDTFSMPPRVAETAKNVKQRAVWTVSPPSKRKQPQPVVKKERSVCGESWVIPVGPAPVKPARKTESESRSRSDSISSTRSLPVRSVKETEMKKDERLVKENEELRSAIADLERKRIRERDQYEEARSGIRLKYEKQLDLMKDEMKHLYNQEITKHKTEQSRLADELKRKNDELRKQNAAYKEDIDDLRGQLWSLGDKLLLNEQTKKKDEDLVDLTRQLERINLQSVDSWKSGNSAADASRSHPRFPSMPVEDEEEIFDNRFLDELKTGRTAGQDRQARLTELQIRNSLCLPHLKSSYPAEMQFISPQACKETDLKKNLPFIESESQSLTDSSDPSMTKSLLPAEKTKKKEQTSYKRPGPPTPSKNARQSLGGDVKLTPKRPLREQNQRGTPSRLKALFSSKTAKRESLGVHDENAAPITPRGKGLRIFQRKPFGGRDF